MYRGEFEDAVRECWRLRKEHGVQSNRHLDPLAKVVGRVFVDAGFSPKDIELKKSLTLPNFFRSTKEWDVVVTYDPSGRGVPLLAAAIEFKAQEGSIGNNFNNRTEEALGSAFDLRTAHQKGLFGPRGDEEGTLFEPPDAGRGVKPWLGYFFLLAEDEESRHRPRTTSRFGIDKEFEGKTYKDRYIVFCKRLLSEGLYDAVCFVASSSADPNSAIDDAPELSFDKFGAAVKKRARAVLRTNQ